MYSGFKKENRRKYERERKRNNIKVLSQKIAL